MQDHKAVRAANRGRPAAPDGATRARVLQAAFAEFRKHGFSGASTLDIATRARVSKRDLYALFDSKHAMLIACIKERAGRMRQPLDAAAPLPQTRQEVVATLRELGASILRGVSHPDVLTVYRLAIAESDRAPEIARALDANGREANEAALGAWLAAVQARGLIGAGDPSVMAAQFLDALWGGLLVRLLLRVREVPTAEEIEQRAQAATAALLHGPPISKAR